MVGDVATIRLYKNGHALHTAEQSGRYVHDSWTLLSLEAGDEITVGISSSATRSLASGEGSQLLVSAWS